MEDYKNWANYYVESNCMSNNDIIKEIIHTYDYIIIRQIIRDIIFIKHDNLYKLQYVYDLLNDKLLLYYHKNINQCNIALNVINQNSNNIENNQIDDFEIILEKYDTKSFTFTHVDLMEEIVTEVMITPEKIL